MTTPSDVMLGSRMDRVQRIALITGVVGAAGCIIGVLLDRDQFFRSYLYAYMFWLGMALGLLGVLMLNHVVGGKWGVVTRRLLEAGAATFPVMLLLLIPVLLGMGSLYFWTRPDVRAHDPVIQSKSAYLNVPFFLGRQVLYWAIWLFYAWLLRRKSDEQDRTADPGLAIRMRQISAPGLVVFTLAGTFACFDLMMSIEPHWYSTIYGGMFLADAFLQAFAFIILVLFALSKYPPFSQIVTMQHFHDLGNLMFAFTILWAYLAFSQWLIIWSGNLPEEIPWYLRRVSSGFGVIAVLLIVFHFFVPFFLLLSRFIKKTPVLLASVAAGMVVIRWIDVYWIIEPGFYQEEFPAWHKMGFHVSWMDFAAPAAIGGLWLFLYIWRLKQRPLVPYNDARLAGAPKTMVSGLK
jgi:hypothetical protein